MRGVRRSGRGQDSPSSWSILYQTVPSVRELGGFSRPHGLVRGCGVRLRDAHDGAVRSSGGQGCTHPLGRSEPAAPGTRPRPRLLANARVAPGPADRRPVQTAVASLTTPMRDPGPQLASASRYGMFRFAGCRAGIRTPTKGSKGGVPCSETLVAPDNSARQGAIATARTSPFVASFWGNHGTISEVGRGGTRYSAKSRRGVICVQMANSRPEPEFRLELSEALGEPPWWLTSASVLVAGTLIGAAVGLVSPTRIVPSVRTGLACSAALLLTWAFFAGLVRLFDPPFRLKRTRGDVEFYRAQVSAMGLEGKLASRMVRSFQNGGWRYLVTPTELERFRAQLLDDEVNDESRYRLLRHFALTRSKLGPTQAEIGHLLFTVLGARRELWKRQNLGWVWAAVVRLRNRGPFKEDPNRVAIMMADAVGATHWPQMWVFPKPPFPTWPMDQQLDSYGGETFVILFKTEERPVRLIFGDPRYSQRWCEIPASDGPDMPWGDTVPPFRA